MASFQSTSQPGSAEHLLSNILKAGKGTKCPHFPKLKPGPGSQVPYKLSFVSTSNPQLTTLKLDNICAACYDAAVPNGFNVWLTGWSGVKNGVLFPRHTEVAPTPVPLIAPSPAKILPALPGFATLQETQAFDWLKAENKPFYVDQIHGTRPYNPNAVKSDAEKLRVLHEVSLALVNCVQIVVTAGTDAIFDSQWCISSTPGAAAKIVSPSPPNTGRTESKSSDVEQIEPSRALHNRDAEAPSRNEEDNEENTANFEWLDPIFKAPDSADQAIRNGKKQKSSKKATKRRAIHNDIDESDKTSPSKTDEQLLAEAIKILSASLLRNDGNGKDEPLSSTMTLRRGVKNERNRNATVQQLPKNNYSKKMMKNEEIVRKGVRSTRTAKLESEYTDEEDIQIQEHETKRKKMHRPIATNVSSSQVEGLTERRVKKSGTKTSSAIPSARTGKPNARELQTSLGGDGQSRGQSSAMSRRPKVNDAQRQMQSGQHSHKTVSAVRERSLRSMPEITSEGSKRSRDDRTVAISSTRAPRSVPVSRNEDAIGVDHDLRQSEMPRGLPPNFRQNYSGVLKDPRVKDLLRQRKAMQTQAQVNHALGGLQASRTSKKAFGKKAAIGVAGTAAVAGAAGVAWDLDENSDSEIGLPERGSNVTDSPAQEEPSTDDPLTDDSPSDDLLRDNSSIDDPSTDEPSTDNADTEEPSTDAFSTDSNNESLGTDDENDDSDNASNQVTDDNDADDKDGNVDSDTDDADHYNDYDNDYDEYYDDST